jgi:lipid A 3-O-deacylase
MICARLERCLGLVGCVAALAFAAGQPARAEGLIHELKIGVLAHDVPDLWSGFRVESNSADINVEVQFAASMALAYGTLRPVIGGSINTDGGTSHGYIDARWQIEGPMNLFFSTGLGAAIHDGETGGPGADPNKKWLGSRVLFHIPVEVGFHVDAHSDVSVYFEHTSNAYTQTYNEGLDRVGLRYGYRF